METIFRSRPLLQDAHSKKGMRMLKIVFAVLTAAILVGGGTAVAQAVTNASGATVRGLQLYAEGPATVKLGAQIKITVVLRNTLQQGQFVNYPGWGALDVDVSDDLGRSIPTKNRLLGTVLPHSHFAAGSERSTTVTLQDYVPVTSAGHYTVIFRLKDVRFESGPRGPEILRKTIYSNPVHILVSP